MEDTSMMQWRKSSYSNGGESACIEVATWRKSSYSSNGGGNCVEVGNGGAVLVRDTTDRQGPMLTFTVDAWQGFTRGLK